MGMSLSTALEIFTNPYDLYFAIIKETRSNKYGLVITRGPDHDYKPLISVPYRYETREAVLDMLRAGLQGTRRSAIDELSSPTSFIAAIVQLPPDTALEEVGLTQAQINKIIEALKTQDTYLTAARPNSAPADRLAETV